MTTVLTEGPNADQAEFWNGASGDVWVDLQPEMDLQIESLGLGAMDAAAPAPGERVLDIGCGCGQSTIELARRTAPDGPVTGIDISSVMLAHARTRATGIANIDFQNVDAESHALPESHFDLAFSRFGVMFFANPAAAFGNFLNALKPSGRLAFVCWRTAEENPWMTLPGKAAFEIIPPPEPMEPDAPGPFAFADSGRVGRILEQAGFTGVDIQPLDMRVIIGGAHDLDRAVANMMRVGRWAADLRNAEQELRDRVAAAVREAMAPHHTPGGVEMDAAAWIVRAHRPADQDVNRDKS